MSSAARFSQSKVQLRDDHIQSWQKVSLRAYHNSESGYRVYKILSFWPISRRYLCNQGNYERAECIFMLDMSSETITCRKILTNPKDKKKLKFGVGPP